MKIQLQPSKDSIDNIKKYFDDQLYQLDNLLTQLNQYFPKKQKELIEEEKRLESISLIKNIEQYLMNVENNITNIERQQQAERYSANVISSLIATETIIKSWLTISEKSFKLGGETLNVLTKGLTDMIAEIPKGLTNSLLEFFNSILYKIITNPSGWIILSIPLFTFFIYFGGIMRVIRIINKGTDKIMTITYGGFVFVYKIVQTPFGYIFKLIRSFIVSEKSEIDELSEALENLNIGGRNVKKIRKTRKNIKNKTKKIKNKKNRIYTKNKNKHKNKKRSHKR
jgi:hypothetical protein